MEAPHSPEPLLPPTRSHRVTTQKTTPTTSTAVKRPIWLTWLPPPTEPANNVLCLAGDYRVPWTAQRDSHRTDLGVPGCVASTDWGRFLDHQTAFRFHSPFLFEPAQCWVLVQTRSALRATPCRTVALQHAQQIDDHVSRWNLPLAHGNVYCKLSKQHTQENGTSCVAVLLTFVTTFINWMWP